MAAKPAKRKCSAKKPDGKRCGAWARKGQEVCLAHSDADTRTSVGFTPEAGRLGGRPRKPRAIEIYRAKVEAEVDAWWQVLVDARTAERGVVVGDGEHARVEYVTDHPTRLKAFREAMDRVYGKPMQFVDVVARSDESEVDREIAELLEEMDARDPELTDVARANGRR